MAIVNYKTNFWGKPFAAGVSCDDYQRPSSWRCNLQSQAMLKVGGFMFFVAAFLSGYGNWLPQVEGGFPPVEEKKTWDSMSPQQLADEGEKIIFGGVGKNKEQGAIGKGQCPLCHAFHAGMLGERAPNLLGLPTRGKERLDDPKYSKGNPSKREYEVKEAFAGSGTAENAQEYIAESHACPSCYVVSGYGVKGTNDKAKSDACYS